MTTSKEKVRTQAQVCIGKMKKTTSGQIKEHFHLAANVALYSFTDSRGIRVDTANNSHDHWGDSNQYCHTTSKPRACKGADGNYQGMMPEPAVMTMVVINHSYLACPEKPSAQPRNAFCNSKSSQTQIQPLPKTLSPKPAGHARTGWTAASPLSRLATHGARAGGSGEVFVGCWASGSCSQRPRIVVNDPL